MYRLMVESFGWLFGKVNLTKLYSVSVLSLSCNPILFLLPSLASSSYIDW